ncbi:MAG: hypothetical protein IJA44_02680, partial [Clostridia bacterium]|nr:hypothetical protein [Clostridia bacterium]
QCKCARLKWCENVNYKKWFLKNTESLSGKTVAVTGSTGGIGLWLCKLLADYKYNMQKDWALQLVGIYEQL